MNIDKLEALARVATPGPWSMAEDGSPVVNAGGRAAHLIGPPGSDEEAAANTQFIVAADPDAILSLIARLREAEEELAHTQGQRDAAILRAQRAEDGEQALALWREEIQSHVERDCAGSDQWRDELVELAAEGYALGSSLVRRDANMRADGIEIAMEDPDMPENVRKRLAALRDFGRHMARQAEQADAAGEYA